MAPCHLTFRPRTAAVTSTWASTRCSPTSPRGAGGVYRALDPDSGREVALKVLPPEVIAGKPNLVERLRREAQAGARLRHENIVSLYEFGESGGAYFLAMELVEGENL